LRLDIAAFLWLVAWDSAQAQRSPEPTNDSSLAYIQAFSLAHWWWAPWGGQPEGGGPSG
jgi:hypothetical protein